MRTGVPTVIPHASGNSSTHCAAHRQLQTNEGIMHFQPERLSASEGLSLVTSCFTR
jgi:hypothetical protein